jgi:UDP-glucose 4-epimerase
MRVLVTGASGFIGHHLSAELQRRGHTPVAFDHLARVGEETFLGDVRDSTAVTEAFAHVDAFVHLAAVLGTQETIANPRPSAETNVFGTLNVLEAAAQYDVPGIYICVGNWWMRNTYSITKTCGEHFVEMFNRERGTRVNNVRCVNAYGPGQRAALPFAPGRVRKIVPALVCRALSGMPIEVYGDGEQVSDMLYVEDLARVLVKALELAAAGVVHPHAIEAGPVVHNTVNDVARLVSQLAIAHTGGKVEIVYLPMRPGEIEGDTVTAKVDTLYSAGIDPGGFVPLESGMAETVEWLHQNKGVTWNPPA